MTKYCRTCRILDPRQNVCQLMRMSVDPNKDFCSKHQENLEQCELCGAGVLTPVLVPDGNNWHTFCDDCSQKLSTCSFCKSANVCAFEQDPSPIPRMIQKQVRMGNMTTVTTVKNPERIRQFCQDKCPCYSEEFECMRQFNYCSNINHKFAANQPQESSKSAEAANSSEPQTTTNSETAGGNMQ